MIAIIRYCYIHIGPYREARLLKDLFIGENICKSNGNLVKYGLFSAELINGPLTERSLMKGSCFRRRKFFQDVVIVILKISSSKAPLQSLDYKHFPFISKYFNEDPRFDIFLLCHAFLKNFLIPLICLHWSTEIPQISHKSQSFLTVILVNNKIFKSGIVPK